MIPRALAVLLALLALSCGPAARPLSSSHRDPSATYPPALSIAPLLETIAQRHGPVQWDALDLLAEVDDPEGRARFAALLSHPDDQLRSHVVRRMAQEPGERFRPLLVAALRDPDFTVREAALRSQIDRPSPESLAVARELVQTCLDHREGPCAYSVGMTALIVANAPDVHPRLEALRALECSPALRARCPECCAVVEVFRLMAGETTDVADLLAATTGIFDRGMGTLLRSAEHRPTPPLCALARSTLSEAALQTRVSLYEFLARCPRDEADLGALRYAAQHETNAWVRRTAAKALPADDAAGTEALVELLAYGEMSDVERMEVAALLAHRGHPAGWPAMERLVAGRRRDGLPVGRRLLARIPFVNAVAGFDGPRADALLRRMRVRPIEEGMAAALVLARRGDRERPAYFRDALGGEYGGYARMLAVAVARVPERSATAP